MATRVWSSHDSIEIDDSVEGPAISYPGVHALSGTFALGAAVRLDGGVFGWGGEGGDGRAEDGDSECVGATNDLFVGGDKPGTDEILGCGVGGG